jgi:hypothetical protein
MKKNFLLIFALFSLFASAQTINDFEFVLVPTKFDFQDSQNEYRLNTILKYRLDEFGFDVRFTSDQINANYSDRCLYLTAYIVNESRFLLTKLRVEFRDCNNVVVFKSDLGTSKTKMRKDAYIEALEKALLSVKEANYKFTGKKTEQTVLATVAESDIATEKNEVISDKTLFAQPIANGFQLIDATPKVVLKIFKTSQPDYFLANADGKEGVVLKRNNTWFFEYYQNDKLISERLEIKF